MAYNHEYPYVDPNRYNADWILHKIKELEREMSDFEALNEITFAGEWDITKQYRAWTIVNTNNGTEGYISIKPVPSGVLITNEDYWASVVNYTATIADLQNRVVALETNQGDLSNLTTSDNSNLVNAINEVNKVAVEGFNHYQPSKCRFVAITDSFGVYTNSFGRNFLAEMQSRYGIANDDFEIIYHGSYGFKSDEFTSLLQQSTISNKTSVDYVLCIGGNNDRGSSEAAILSGILSFCNYAKTNFPNAKIIIGYDAWNDQLTGINAVQAYVTYQKGASINGAGFADMASALHSTQYLVDGIHPTQAGVERLTQAIMKYMESGDASLALNGEFLQFTSEKVTAQDWYLIGSIFNNVLNLMASKPINWTVDGTLNINNNANVGIGTMTSTVINSYDQTWSIIPVTCDVTDGGGLHVNCNMAILFVGPNLFMRNYSGSNLSGITAITIKPFVTTLPIIGN